MRATSEVRVRIATEFNWIRDLRVVFAALKYLALMNWNGIVFIAAAGILLSSCQSKVGPASFSHAPREVIVPKYAKGFQLYRDGEERGVILFNLEREGDTLLQIHIDSLHPESSACLSTTHISFLAELGLLDHVSGVCYAGLIPDAEIQERISNGSIKNLTTGEEIDRELLFSISPGIIFSYPFGELQVPPAFQERVVPISEYLESSPLGRAEWVKVFGWIFGKEEMADSLFNEEERLYLEVANQAMNRTEKPSVFVGSYDGSSWYAPPASSFLARWIADAGGTYAMNDGNEKGNSSLTEEEVIYHMNDIAYWGELLFGEGAACDNMRGWRSTYSGMRARKENHMFYCNTSRQDYFGKAVIHPHLVLEDFVHLFHPDLLPGHTPQYFILCDKHQDSNG